MMSVQISLVGQFGLSAGRMLAVGFGLLAVYRRFRESKA